MDEKRFPKYIPKPLKIFIILEMDDLMVAGLFWVLQITTDNGWYFFGMFLGPIFYRWLRGKYHRGFLLHFLFYLGIYNFEGYPSALETKFQE